MRVAGLAKASGMTGDFGTELDAALNGHLDALRAAATDARRRIENGARDLAAAAGPAPAPAPARPQPSPRPVADPSPIRFAGGPMHPAAAVSFDMEEGPPEIEGLGDDDLPPFADVDAEGIPMPEDN